MFCVYFLPIVCTTEKRKREGEQKGRKTFASKALFVQTSSL